MNTVHIEAASDKVAGLLGENRSIDIVVDQVRDGYVFTYAGCFDNHSHYCLPGQKPFATIADAVAAARDPGDENGNFEGPGAGVEECDYVEED